LTERKDEERELDASQEESPPVEEELGSIPSLTSSGPLSSSVRVGILAALLSFRRTTFTELMIVVNIPKSSLNFNLAVLKENSFITIRRGFMGAGRPRTIIEITPEGEKAIKGHLTVLQNLAKKLLSD
jgi:DNA-binding MarR family transcriptional regulator